MTKLLLRHKVNLARLNKKRLQPMEIAASEEIYNLIHKAKRFETI
jgi:hypothetical protein